MICFPNAKINLGLDVIEKRSDGYHNIETIFYPVDLRDALEVIPLNKEDKNIDLNNFYLKNTGININVDDIKKNLVFKAYNVLNKDYNIPPFKAFLHKNIPFGAGLGGGSSDAAFMLKLLNETFKLNLSEKILCDYASTLGADCAFFIKNRPIFARNIGDVFEDVSLSLKGFFMILVKPNIFVSTKDAYGEIIPTRSEISVKNIIAEPIDNWKELLKNDFEKVVFKKYPEIEEIKNHFYSRGALYSAMTGSGSSVFGIFKESISLKNDFKDSYYKEINL